MQTDVLEKIDEASLRILVAWVPILPDDSEAAAIESSALVPDARASHFWDATRVLPPLFAPVLGLPESWPAWDVYMVFATGVRWVDAPPTPSYWEHQLGDEVDAPVLDGERFREAVLDALRSSDR
jgi:hypothetical protein